MEESTMQGEDDQNAMKPKNNERLFIYFLSSKQLFFHSSEKVFSSIFCEFPYFKMRIIFLFQKHQKCFKMVNLYRSENVTSFPRRARHPSVFKYCISVRKIGIRERSSSFDPISLYFCLSFTSFFSSSSSFFLVVFIHLLLNSTFFNTIFPPDGYTVDSFLSSSKEFYGYRMQVRIS